MAEENKACPFCGESILAVAIKCKHCGSMFSSASGPGTPVPAQQPDVARSMARLPREALHVAVPVLVAAALVGAVPIFSPRTSNGPDSRYLQSLAGRMTDDNAVIISSEGVKVVSRWEGADLARRVAEVKPMSPRERLQYCLVGSGCPGIGISGVLPWVGSKADVLTNARSAEEAEAIVARKAMLPTGLGVAAFILLALAERIRPWRTGGRLREPAARRNAALAVAACSAALAVAAFAWLFPVTRMYQHAPDQVMLPAAAAVLALAWVAVRSFLDWRKLKVTEASAGGQVP